MAEMPDWNPPHDIAKGIEDSDGLWEDDRWSPILLTAMSRTTLDCREIPVAWQIEFDPTDDAFAAANERLEAEDLAHDGYGWGEHIQESIREFDPALAKRLHMFDCEVDTCVIWVESAEDCRKLLETTWKLIFNE
jgi:hypothetical protein